MLFAKSIKWRVQSWVGLLLLLLLSGFGITAYQLYRTNRLGAIDEELEQRLSALVSDVRKPPPFLGPRPGSFPLPNPAEAAPEGPGDHPHLPRRFDRGPAPSGPRSRGDRFSTPEGLPPPQRPIEVSPLTLSLFDPTQTNGFYFALWSGDGSILQVTSNAPAKLARPSRGTAAAGILTRMQGAEREAYVTTELGEIALVGRSVQSDLAALRRFAWSLVGAGLGVLALGLGGGWIVAGRAIRPVEAISATASRIAAGNLAERIALAETDSELGRLAAVLNDTFARLETAFAQQRQFTADASHELRTPLAVMISEAQTTLARERTAAEYREAVEACLQTAQQMRHLTQSLLELARLDAGQAGLAREPADLAPLADACRAGVLPLAQARSIQIHTDLRPAPFLGDADRVSQVLTNLLSNAIQYNRDGGEIRLETRAEPQAAVVRVTDTGSGIPPESLPHVFEHFYRGDKARTATAGRGHFGLGLAITKAIVEAHGGEITATSEPGQGATFTARFPVGQGVSS